MRKAEARRYRRSTALAATPSLSAKMLMRIASRAMLLMHALPPLLMPRRAAADARDMLIRKRQLRASGAAAGGARCAMLAHALTR